MQYYRLLSTFVYGSDEPVGLRMGKKLGQVSTAPTVIDAGPVSARYSKTSSVAYLEQSVLSFINFFT